MKEKGEKILIIICFTVLFTLFVGGLGLSFLVGYNPKIPDAVQIVDDGNNVYIYSEMNDNYSSCRFKFENDEDGNIYIDSKKNILTMSEMLHSGIEVGKEYRITVTFVTDDDSFNSMQSKPLDWKVYDYLATPNIYSSGNYINWSGIENADFYEVHYNLKSDDKFITTENTFFDLQNIPGGQRDVYVIAKSNNESYKTSLKSNTLELSVVHRLASFENAQFDGVNKTISMTCKEKIEKMIIYIGESQHERENLTPVLTDGVYHYLVDITTIYEHSAIIGIAPMTIDQYNVYYGGILYLQ